MAGGIRDLILFRNFNLIAGFVVIILVTGSKSCGSFPGGALAVAGGLVILLVFSVAVSFRTVAAERRKGHAGG